jgi:tetratricopeptide (TPR) repeat protein
MPDKIKDWEKEEGDFGMHHQDVQEDPWAAQEAMQQLIELGYIDAPDENIATRIESSKNESQYYLARNFIDGSKYDQAIEVLELLVENNSKEVRYGQRLAFCYLNTNRFKKCRKLIDQLKVIQEEIEKEEAGMSEEELNKRKKGFIREAELPNYLLFVEGLLFMKVNKLNKAIHLFKEVIEKVPNNLEVHLNIGKAFLHKQKWVEAEGAFINCLAIDETNSIAHHGLGLTFLRRDQYESALDEFFLSLETNYAFPNTHYHIGETLMKLGKIKESEQAFKAAISLAPGMTKAHRWLADLYQNELNEPLKAKEHLEFLEKNIKGEVVIVSGLPRSGTSMMMQILDAVGMDILTDQNRKADENNPKGYYEYDPVKKLMVDKSWLPIAKGKVVKVIAQLLPYLPSNYDYKVIFMRREMSEVLKSQQIMLGKEKDVSKKAFPTGLNDAFLKQLSRVETWIESQPNIDVLNVNYKDVIDQPTDEVEAISAFLGLEIDAKKVNNVIDESLYRNRK